MKTLKDLKFELNRLGTGVIGKCFLSNGCEISVAMTKDTYGGTSGLWEVCVFENGSSFNSLYLNCLSGGTVEGYLTTEELENKMIEIQKELKA
jgi:hypothetical protein